MEDQIAKIPSVAVSIVTWNSAGDIGACLAPLGALPENWSVWVVDNASADETVEVVRRDFPHVNLIANPDNKGFAAANNQVVAAATDADWVLFLNPDTRCEAGALARALQIAAGDPKIGILGVRMVYEDGAAQLTCFHYPTFWKNFVDGLGLYGFYSAERLESMFAGEFFAHDAERNADWIKGAFMLARRAAIDDAGGGIPEDYFMFAEDLDFCWRVARAGWDVRFTPEVTVVHAANRSAGQLPSQWRAERTTLSKHLFCLRSFGAVTGRLIQLTDLLAVNYKILRGRDPRDIAEWKMFRREIFKGCLMSRSAIRAKLQER